MLVADRNDAQYRSRIADYYDSLLRYYEWFWHGSTGGLHYGLRTDQVRGWRNEILNTNAVLARLAGIRRGARVLDAGCGVAGSAIWLQRNLGCSTSCVTLSRRQAITAHASIASRALAPSIKVLQADNHQLPFPDASFDVVWGLESVCYSDKKRFLREASRVLRPGGTLVIGDGFLIRRPRNAGESHILDRFLDGLVLPELITIDDFVALFEGASFEAPEVHDLTEAATPSSRRLYWMCRFALPLCRIMVRLGLVPPLLRANLLAGIAQGRLVANNIAGYYAVVAKKPDQGLRDSP